MRILIISDDPKGTSFYQIAILKDLLQKKVKSKVDLFALSPEFLFFNNRVISRRTDVSTVLKKLENLLKRGLYSLYIISLKADNLMKVFPSENRNFLEMAKMYSKNAIIFIFGAPTILNNMEKFCEEPKINLFLIPRHGVAKITDELRKQILNYVQTRSEIS